MKLCRFDAGAGSRHGHVENGYLVDREDPIERHPLEAIRLLAPALPRKFLAIGLNYADPDGNNVELQVDCFGDWKKSTEWMRSSDDFKANPIGVFVDPELVAADHANGMSFAEIHADAMAGAYAPKQAPVEIPEMS